VIGSSFPAVLAAAQDGDEQAFAVLWRDLQPAVLRYLQVAAPPVAEDLAADAWVSVIRGLGRFRGDERAFRGWLFTAARHRVVDWRRQVARRPTQPLPDGLLVGWVAPDDPAAAVLEAHSTRAAYQLIAELPHDQAEVLALRILGGLEVAEVARVMGRRPGAVRALAYRGTRRLAQRLEAARVAGRRVTG
jgi:RNA polymerase sigma-70 factor (ECF subfamily)